MRLASSASASSSSASSSPTHSRANLPPADSQTAKGVRRRMDKTLTQFKSSYPLQRGSACLSCRKRKMKCDAGKPSCGQCIKANRASDCDYDDGKSKSRTQLLQEKISLLEGRLRELEGGPSQPRPVPPALHRFNTTPSYSNSSASSFDGLFNGADAHAPSSSPFDLSSLTASTAGSPSDSTHSQVWVGDQYDLQVHNNGLSRVATPDELPWDVDPLSMTPDDLLKASGRWWEVEMPPNHIQHLLLDIFLPHRHQCGFEVDTTRFQASLSSADPPHPALLNAIYALSCHFSLSPLLTPHEPRFVSRALRAISRALEASDRLIHVLQASCLLAVLFFAKGRLLEGYYHAGAAARLAVGLGLHQIPLPEWGNSPEGSPRSSPALSTGMGGSSSILPPPVDSTELGERILAFWQVFNLDRCWAVATGLPVALSDDSHPRTRIETVWPRSLEEYELGSVSDADYGTVHYLYSQMTTLPFSQRDSVNALRAKATTLFERAARLSSSFGTSTQSAEQFWVDFQTVDAAISRLLLTVPSARQPAGGDESTQANGTHGHGQTRIEVSLYVVHALLQAATIQLHSPFALKDAASQSKSAGVAALATGMIHELEEMDYAYLDPIMGTCWTSVAEALVREMIVLRVTPGMEGQVEGLNRQLDVVVMAMNRLGTTVPLAAYQASKVEQSRVISY